jgi:hypothetical protein
MICFCSFWELMSCVIWQFAIYHVSLSVKEVLRLQNVVKHTCKQISHLRRSESFLHYVCIYIRFYTHIYIFLYIFYVILKKILIEYETKTLDQSSIYFFILMCHKLGTNHGVTAPDALHRSSVEENFLMVNHLLKLLYWRISLINQTLRTGSVCWYDSVLNVVYIPRIVHNLQEHHIVLCHGGRRQDVPVLISDVFVVNMTCHMKLNINFSLWLKKKYLRL